MGTARRLSMIAAVGAALALAACGGGGGSKSTSAGGTAPTSPAATPAPTVAASTAGAAIPGPIPVVAPNGFERVERLCYSVALPKGSVNRAETSCLMRAHWDPTGGVYFQPDPYAKSLAEMVSRFKSDKNVHPLIVDKDITVGGFPAHMFVEDNHTVTGPAQGATVVVYLPSKSYEMEGTEVNAFNIIGNYSTAAQYPDYGANDKAFDAIIASVQWK